MRRLRIVIDPLPVEGGYLHAPDGVSPGAAVDVDVDVDEDEDEETLARYTALNAQEGDFAG